jgi:drug/metabolite transporter (DMT)-like permease
MSNTKLKGYFAWISVCIVWGTTYLAIRIGVAHIPPMLFAGIRWIIAGLIFVSILRISKINFPKFEDLKHIAIIGLLMFHSGLLDLILSHQKNLFLTNLLLSDYFSDCLV